MKEGKDRKGERAEAARWLETAGEEVLLPGLHNDVALRCLAFVPYYLYPLLASLNKTFRRLIISARCAPLMLLRRSLGLVDHLLISEHPSDGLEDETVHINGQEQVRVKMKWSLRVLDIKRGTWINLTVPPFIDWRGYDTFFCSGTRLFCFSYSLANVGILYDFTSHKWEVCPRMREPTRRWCAFASSGECCFVAGGHKTCGHELSSGETLSSAEMYSLRRRTWCRLPRMPVARHLCAGFIMDDKFYVIGGTDYRGDRKFADVEEYNPSTKVWRTVHDMCLRASNRNFPLVSVHNNQLYAIDDEPSSPLNPTLHVYEKQANTWRPLGPVLDNHGEGDLRIRNGGLVSMGCDKLMVLCEWWPTGQKDGRKAHILSWEATPEAIACEFRVIYSGQITPSYVDEFQISGDGNLREEAKSRLFGHPWLAVVI